MQPTDKQKKFIRQQIKRIKDVMYLNRYTLDIHYMEEDEPQETYASMSGTGEYLQAELRLFPAFWKQDKEGQLMTLVHEFCHIPLFELVGLPHKMLEGKMISRDQIGSANERATEAFALAVYRATYSE